MLITSDLGGADPAAEVEAWIRVCAPADADDAQGGPPSDASVEHGLLQEGQEGSVDADPVYERVDEPAVDRQVFENLKLRLITMISMICVIISRGGCAQCFFPHTFSGRI